MTSAGSARIAAAVEDAFLDLPDIPTWFQPGENVEVGSASLENALARARQPDDPRPDGSREGNKEGALDLTYAMTDTQFHDLVFPATDPVGLARSASRAPTATYYIEADLLDGVQDRFLAGGATESLSINYTQGEDVTVNQTVIYADEPEVGGTHADAPGAGEITQPDKDDIVRWHGADLQIDGVSVEELQSFSIDISGMARFRRGQQRAPTEAVVGAYEPSLSVEATLLDGTQLEYAYGSSTATEPQTEIDERPATATFDNPAGTLVSYDLADLQPTTYDWSGLTDPDTDITDPVDYHMTDVSVV